MLLLTSFHCQVSVLHPEKTTRRLEARSHNVIIIILFFSRVKMGSPSQFDVTIWIRSSSSVTATPVARVICSSPSQRFREASSPPSPNFTSAAHLPWILYCSAQRQHILIPFPFPSLQGPHKVNPNLFARDGLIITPACLSLSHTVHRDNRPRLLILYAAVRTVFHLDSLESLWSLVSQSELKTASASR